LKCVRRCSANASLPSASVPTRNQPQDPQHQLHPGLHENPGAGTPDCHWSSDGVEWAWEIKSARGQEVEVGARDVGGLSADRPGLVVLDVAFPARVWVLDASGVGPGVLRPQAHAHRHRADEAEPLARILEEILRRCDIDLLTSEQDAKKLVRELSATAPPRAESDFERL
jgi:hypothetical protein